jgi:hypothetical protein
VTEDGGENYNKAHLDELDPLEAQRLLGAANAALADEWGPVEDWSDWNEPASGGPEHR